MKVNREKLFLAMAKKCMGPDDVCRKVKMPRPTLNGAINGRNIRPVTLGKIAAALGVEPEEIIE